MQSLREGENAVTFSLDASAGAHCRQTGAVPTSINGDYSGPVIIDRSFLTIFVQVQREQREFFLKKNE